MYLNKLKLYLFVFRITMCELKTKQLYRSATNGKNAYVKVNIRLKLIICLIKISKFAIFQGDLNGDLLMTVL